MCFRQPKNKWKGESGSLTAKAKKKAKPKTYKEIIELKKAWKTKKIEIIKNQKLKKNKIAIHVK